MTWLFGLLAAGLLAALGLAGGASDRTAPPAAEACPKPSPSTQRVPCYIAERDPNPDSP